MTDLLKDMRKMSGLLVKATACISELEMRVELLSEELKGNVTNSSNSLNDYSDMSRDS